MFQMRVRELKSKSVEVNLISNTTVRAQEDASEVEFGLSAGLPYNRS